MKTELLYFYAKDGLALQGLLFRSRPRNTTVMLNVFGMVGNFFGSERIEKFAKAAAGTNVDFFSASNRGMGAVFSFHKRNGERKFIGTAHERFEDCVFDIGGAIEFLKSMGYKRIILVGHSTGCQKSVFYQYVKRDPSVKGIVLLAPMGDYDIAKKILGKRLAKAVAISRRMVKEGRGHETTPTWISYYSAARFLSYAVPTNPEARLFNYDSALTEFKSIRCPILVVIGSKEENRTKPIKEHMRILHAATTAKHFDSVILDGADHGFRGKESQLAKIVVDWVCDNI